MADIYIDPSVSGMPDAASHLTHFVDTGHHLILVGDCPGAVLDALPGADAAEALPEAFSPGAWHMSADPAICGNRTPGLRTLYVGPRLAPSPRPGPRCEAEARDLASAVLEILSRDAMG